MDETEGISPGSGQTATDTQDGTSTGTPGDIPGVSIEMPGDRAVNYIFPVEVIVVGALTEEEHRAIERRIWTSFKEAWAQQSA